MYICGDCGKLFEEPKGWSQNHGEPHLTERWSGCPKCGGGFDEAIRCSRCGKYFDAEETSHGYCEDCLKEVVSDKFDYDLVLAYFIRYDLLIDFLYGFYYAIDTTISPTNDEFRRDAIELYKRKVTNDKILQKLIFKGCIVEYIENDLEHYAEWLERKEVI